MGIFKNIFSNKSVTPTDKDFFYPIGTDVYTLGENTPIQNLKYFNEVPELNNVATTKARMFADMELSVKSRITEKDVPLTNSLQKIIKNPNWWQSQKELLKQISLYENVHGNSYSHFLRPVGFGVNSVKQWSALNPIYLTRKVLLNQKPNFLTLEAPEGDGWNYSDTTGAYDIAYNEVLHMNSDNISNSDDIGVSPLMGLRYNLDNIISAYEARGKNLRSHGAIGILSNAAKDGIGAAAPMDVTEKENVQKAFAKYGIAKGQWSTIITNLSLNWQKMGGNVKDLMLFEEIEDDFQKICDKLGMQRQMFANTKGTTFDNKKEATKQTYTTTIIPDAQVYINALNDYFQTEKTSYVIVGTYKHLQVFDEDKKERAQAIVLTTNGLSKAYEDGAITLDEYQKELAKHGIGDKPK